MNGEINTLIKRKNWLYQRQRGSGNRDHNILNAFTTDTLHAVNTSKFKYALQKSLMTLKRQLKPIGQS